MAEKMVRNLFSDVEKFQINFCVIRETYRYMAKIDKIPNAMSRFYRYLEVDENTYDKLISEGAYAVKGNMKPCVKQLIRCGYSDAIFRKDSPALIKMSDLLLDEVCEYLFEKNVTLKELRQDLEMYLGTIQNTEDTLLVYCTRNLINNVYEVSEPDDTLLDFINVMEEYEHEGHFLQKEVIPDSVNSYEQYKANVKLKEEGE